MNATSPWTSRKLHASKSRTEEIEHSMRYGIGKNVRRRGGRFGFGGCRIATSTTVSGDEAMENRTRMGKRPNTADTIVDDDEGVDEPWVSIIGIKTDWFKLSHLSEADGARAPRGSESFLSRV